MEQHQRDPPLVLPGVSSVDLLDPPLTTEESEGTLFTEVPEYTIIVCSGFSVEPELSVQLQTGGRGVELVLEYRASDFLIRVCGEGYYLQCALPHLLERSTKKTKTVWTLSAHLLPRLLRLAYHWGRASHLRDAVKDATVLLYRSV